MQLTIIIFSALLLVSPARADVQTPEGTMHDFYAWVLVHPSLALPSPRQRVRLAMFLSPQLVQLLKEASDTERRCVKVSPKDEKPNVIEGDLFVGNYEGATEVAYGNPRRDGDKVVVESDLVYVDPRFPKAHKHRVIAWKDTLELQLTGTRWLVQDVRFQQRSSLAAGLRDYITAGAQSCVQSQQK